MTRRGIIGDAYALRRQCRDEYDLYLDAEHGRAHDDCNGRLLNRDGYDAGIDPRSLFYGSYDRAIRYASDELVEWWLTHRRRNYQQFEDVWVAGQGVGYL